MGKSPTELEQGIDGEKKARKQNAERTCDFITA